MSIYELQQMKTILWVQDMERAVRFYVDVFGLEIGMQSPYWSELLHQGSMLALHGGAGGAPGPTQLGFQVSDVDAAVDVAVMHGAVVVDPPANRQGEPIRIASIKDSEGNVIAVSQYLPPAS